MIYHAVINTTNYEEFRTLLEEYIRNFYDVVGYSTCLNSNSNINYSCILVKKI